MRDEFELKLNKTNISEKNLLKRKEKKKPPPMEFMIQFKLNVITACNIYKSRNLRLQLFLMSVIKFSCTLRNQYSYRVSITCKNLKFDSLTTSKVV